MKKSGELLREARLSKNLSIHDVAENTKIRPSYIEAIENSDYNVFHSPTTIRGFLKNYSNYIGLNADNVIAIYRREITVKNKITEKKSVFKLPNFHISSNIFILFGAVIIVLAVIGFFAYQYVQVSKPPEFDIKDPINGFVTTQDKVKIRVISAKGVDIYVNNKNITTIDENGNLVTDIDLVDGSNNILVVAINGYKKETRKSITVFKNPPDSPVQNTSLNISIRSTSSTQNTISYSIDGNPFIDKKFNVGETLTLSAKQKINISGAANMNNLFEVTINETKVSLLSNTPKQQIIFQNNTFKVSTAQ